MVLWYYSRNLITGRAPQVLVRVARHANASVSAGSNLSNLAINDNRVLWSTERPTQKTVTSGNPGERYVTVRAVTASQKRRVL